MKTHEIRKRFTDHYVKHGHTLVPAAPLVLEDPTLLFVNAGMVPFKPYFLGQQTPPYKTATSIQNCVRTLDIEEVGVTTRHNTFFQMAGNFSFGDYFKEKAITLAWSLLTTPVSEGGYGLEPQRLWATVYEDDDEAFAIWGEKTEIPKDHIQRRGMKDNFWSMGVPGPCGPSSEIFYDKGPKYGPDGGPIVDEDRFPEIWNLVFMEKERGEGVGKDGYEIVGTLPNKNIDTGMGVERVAAILQGVDNVYETDLLRPTIDVAEKLTGSSYQDSEGQDLVYFRVIADHSRTAVMLAADGITPSNEGRGYILRRLIRRVIRSARLLGAQDAVMEKLVAVTCESMAPSFPELKKKAEHISQVCQKEEKAFLRTLDTGTKLFEKEATQLQKSGETVIPGKVAFTLHDTHGFPIDLTVEMAAEKGLSVDREGFHVEMQKQRQRAKADSQAKKQGHADLSVYRPYIDNHPTEYVGYDDIETDARLLAVIVDGKEVTEAEIGTKVELILDRSPFYAESGGQSSDRGSVSSDDGEVSIDDVQKVGKTLWVHHGFVSNGVIRPGFVKATVDEAYHRHAKQAHTATHLVHAALQVVLGEDAVQAGSMNKPGYLRFDFNWSEPLSASQLAEIEHRVNTAIDEHLPVTKEIMSLEEAQNSGAIGLFGESYGEDVRVVTIGRGKGRVYSKELCGGNHVNNTAEIGPVRFIGETSVASGIRRIEANVGLVALDAARADQQIVETLAQEFKCRPGEIVSRVEGLQETVRALEKKLTALQDAAVTQAAGDLAAKAETINEIRVVADRAPAGTTGKQLRTLATDVRGRFGEQPAAVVLFAEDGGKVPFVAALTKAAIDKGLKAGAIIQKVGPSIGGRGGGKPDLAQGAGNDAQGIDAAIAQVHDLVSGL